MQAIRSWRLKTTDFSLLLYYYSCMRRKIVIGLILLIIGLIISRPVWLPILFIPNLLPENRLRPLEWITRQPMVENIKMPFEDQSLSADLYLPKSDFMPEKILLLIHGANEKGKDDPRITNFGQSLARAGIATIIPTFPDILRDRFTPEASEQIKTTLMWLNQKYPNTSLGMISFSVAGGPMLIAANLSGQFKLLLAFGSHYDLKNVLKYVTTKTYEFENQTFTNEPDPFAKDLLKTQYEMEFGLDPAIDALFKNTDPGEFDALYENLRPEVKQFIVDLSPAGHLNNIKSDQILIVHSDPDLVIPHTESLKLKEALGDRADITLLQVFSHVNIQFPKFNLKTLFNYYLPEAGKLYKIIFQVLR
jgi:hypothetical protein